MPNKIEFKGGDGITLQPDAANKSITIKTKVTDAELAKLAATGNNALVTKAEVQSMIANNGGGGNTGPAPENFPKFFTTSTNGFIIPKTGRYRISMVGGGGGGAIVRATEFSNGGTGGATIVKIGGNSYTATGGNPGTNGSGGISSIPYDGTKGSVKGGNPGQPGENGAGAGGLAITTHYTYSGGGGGSPLNYNVNDISGDNGTQPVSSGSILAYGGKGYGAGGGGASNHVTSSSGAGGGASGYLIIKELQINENTNIDITIGAGGKGGYITDLASYPSGGSGAQGAVLLEWVE